MKILYGILLVGMRIDAMAHATGHVSSPDGTLVAWWEKSAKNLLGFYDLRVQKKSTGYSHKILIFSEPYPLTFSGERELSFETQLRRYVLALSHHGALAKQSVELLTDSRIK